MKIVCIFSVQPLLLITCLYSVTLSTILYWYVVEAGTALIAACLPSLRFFFTNKSLQSVLYSIRSVVSLRSTASRQADYYTDIESNHSISNARQIYGQKDTQAATHVVGGIGKDTELHHLPQRGQIQVEHELSQTFEDN